MTALNGLELTCTPALRELLRSAAKDVTIDEGVRSDAAELASEEKVSWKRLRLVSSAIRERSGQGDGRKLHTLLKGSNIVLPAVPVRKRNPELVARLERLQRLDEERRYSAMVHDVTASERHAQAVKEGGLVTYKDQLSYGVHVVVVMGVFYGIGHMAAGSFSPKPSMRAAGGLLGMVGAMLMECILLIIRTSDYGAALAKKKQAAAPKSQPARSQGRIADPEAKKRQ